MAVGLGVWVAVGSGEWVAVGSGVWVVVGSGVRVAVGSSVELSWLHCTDSKYRFGSISPVRKTSHWRLLEAQCLCSPLTASIYGHRTDNCANKRS